MGLFEYPWHSLLSLPLPSLRLPLPPSHSLLLLSDGLSICDSQVVRTNWDGFPLHFQPLRCRFVGTLLHARSLSLPPLWQRQRATSCTWGRISLKTMTSSSLPGRRTSGITSTRSLRHTSTFAFQGRAMFLPALSGRLHDCGPSEVATWQEKNGTRTSIPK